MAFAAAVLLAPGLAALAAPVASRAATAVAPASAEEALEQWVPVLLDGSAAERLEVLQAMRRSPGMARQALLLALEDWGGHERRWRLVHHLAEFGRTSDIPRVLALRDAARTGRERAVIHGAARGLYRPSPEPPLAAGRLRDAVREFLFLRTGGPEPYRPELAGRLVLDDATFAIYHRDRLPPEVIAALEPLRGQAFAARRALVEAMRERLAPRAWQRRRQALLAPVAPLPERVVVEGVLRVQVRNPLDRPLLLRVGFDAWNGGFVEPPPARLLYLGPGQRGRLDQSVRLVARRGEPPARLDLRLAEAHRAPVPTLRKLYLPIAP